MNLEYLRHGKALCGKVFRRFVETFNFHNDFISNLKGDADLPVVGGFVYLDRRDERHPVIRCRLCGGGGNGSGGGGSSGYTGTIRVATGEQRCNSTSGYYIQSEYITCNVENGVIKSVVLDDQGNPKKEWTTGLQTIPLSDAR